MNLNYGRPDAESFVKAVQKRSKNIYKSINSIEIFDDNATREVITATFDSIKAKAEPKDTFFSFMQVMEL